MTPRGMATQLARVRAAMPRTVRAALVEVGTRGERVVKEGMLSGGRLKVRSGRLRNSVTMAVSDSPVQMELGAGRARGVDVKYAAILEDGGVIVPKRGKFLAIPTPGGPACTRSGVVRAGWESPRTAPVKLRFVPTARGGVLLADKGKRGGTVVAYNLVRRVTIKARHYMRDAGALVTEAFPEVLARRIDQLFEVA